MFLNIPIICYQSILTVVFLSLQEPVSTTNENQSDSQQLEETYAGEFE